MTTSAQPAAAAPKYKRSIKNYLLDAKFQLRWTGYLVAVALVISGILGGFLYRTSNQVAEESNKVLVQGEELLKESKRNSDLVRMQTAEDPLLQKTFDDQANKLDADLKEKHLKLEAQGRQTKAQQQMMLMSLVGGLSLLVLLIGIVGIYITHKVVGPIYKMKLLLKQVGDGKLNFQGRLRKGDEFQDFFEVFAKMVDQLKSRQAGEVETLEGAMKAAKESGASEDAIAKIAIVRDQMQAALGK